MNPSSHPLYPLYMRLYEDACKGCGDGYGGYNSYDYYDGDHDCDGIGVYDSASSPAWERALMSTRDPHDEEE